MSRRLLIFCFTLYFGLSAATAAPKDPATFSTTRGKSTSEEGCAKALQLRPDQRVSETVGPEAGGAERIFSVSPEASRQVEDTYETMTAFQQMLLSHRQGQSVLPADVFLSLVNDRERDTASWAWYEKLVKWTLTLGNSKMLEEIGAPLQAEAVLEDSYNRMFDRNNSDPDFMKQVVQKQRGLTMQALFESIMMDVRYSQVYQEFYRVLVSIPDSLRQESYIFGIVDAYYKKLGEISSLRSKTAQLIEAGTPPLAFSNPQREGEFLEESVRLRRLLNETRDLEKQIRTELSELESKVGFMDFDDPQIPREYEIMKKLIVLMDWEKASNNLLFGLVMQAQKLEVLEKILKRRWAGYTVEPDVNNWRNLTRFLERNRAYLDSSDLFGAYYKKVTAAGNSPEKIYSALRHELLDPYLNLWYVRVDAMTPRLQVRYALRRLGRVTGKVLWAINVKAFGSDWAQVWERIKRTGWLGNLPEDFSVSDLGLGLLPEENEGSTAGEQTQSMNIEDEIRLDNEAPEVDKDTARAKEKVAKAMVAIGALHAHIATYDRGTTAEDRDEFRIKKESQIESYISDIRLYLDYQLSRRMYLHSVVSDAFGSNVGSDIAAWMRDKIADGKAYDWTVVEWINKERGKRIALQNQRSNVSLARNILARISGFGSFLFGLLYLYFSFGAG